MAEKILMPRLTDTMTEGVIAEWHKKIGDVVKKGDLLADIDTDKATMELESYKNGTILYLGGEKGSKINVDELLAIVGEKGEDITKLIGEKGNADTATQMEAKESKPEVTEKPINEQVDKGDNKKEENPTLTTNTVAKKDEVVLMPRLSDTMTEGVIAYWAKNVGDDVIKGDLLADIETDKATMELESYKNGKLLYQGAKKGEKIKVNDLLCIIGEEDKVDVEAVVKEIKDGAAGEKNTLAEAKMPASEMKEEKQERSSTTENDRSENNRLKASPLAKRLATEKGIDLKYITGSGDGGRITKSDIDNYKPAANAQSGGSIIHTSEGAIGTENFEEVPVSQMRKVIGKRLAESKFSAPHFYLTMVINMDNAVASRVKINETSVVKISFNDFVLKACAIALKQHPAINSSWLGDKIRINHHINIGVAVAVEEGLLVPVVRFADTKSLSQIAIEVKEFAKKAKDKKLQPADWEGNTFTISNLGMFGIDEFTAIINLPDACILAVGGIAEIPIVKDGAVVPGNIMKVTLSCDHRVVDGAKGAAFLQTFKNLLEEPLRMLV